MYILNDLYTSNSSSTSAAAFHYLTKLGKRRHPAPSCGPSAPKTAPTAPVFGTSESFHCFGCSSRPLSLALEIKDEVSLVGAEETVGRIAAFVPAAAPTTAADEAPLASFLEESVAAADLELSEAISLPGDSFEAVVEDAVDASESPLSGLLDLVLQLERCSLASVSVGLEAATTTRTTTTTTAPVKYYSAAAPLAKVQFGGHIGMAVIFEGASHRPLNFELGEDDLVIASSEEANEEEEVFEGTAAATVACPSVDESRPDVVVAPSGNEKQVRFGSPIAVFCSPAESQEAAAATAVPESTGACTAEFVQDEDAARAAIRKRLNAKKERMRAKAAADCATT